MGQELLGSRLLPSKQKRSPTSSLPAVEYNGNAESLSVPGFILYPAIV